VKVLNSRFVRLRPSLAAGTLHFQRYSWRLRHAHFCDLCESFSAGVIHATIMIAPRISSPAQPKLPTEPPSERATGRRHYWGLDEQSDCLRFAVLLL
jgi:hypothetical protein